MEFWKREIKLKKYHSEGWRWETVKERGGTKKKEELKRR